MTDVLVGGTAGAISDKYLVPPFSVLDTRLDHWRKRRSWWMALGIRSEVGRGQDLAFNTATMADSYVEKSRRAADGRSNLNGYSTLPDYANFGTALIAPGTSIFDPVLCELAYRWFAPEGGSVLDPFAGGSVRGIVAATLGHAYTGVDLSSTQIAANEAQADAILTPDQPRPRWVHGDSRLVLQDIAGASADLVFTCPPYFDLEVYSDDPADLSNATSYEAFIEGYRLILAEAARRVDKQFTVSRKLGRMHQNVIIAVKGDAQRDWDNGRPAPPDPQTTLFGDAA